MRKWLSVSAALLSVLLLFSCARYRTGDTSAVMTVGGRKVAGELWSYVFDKNKAQYFGADKPTDALSNDERALLTSAAENELKKYFAIFILADQYGVSLDKEDEERIEDYIAGVKSDFETEDLYYADLQTNCMSENVFYEQCRNMALDAKLFEARKPSINKDLTDDALRADISEYCYAVVQILWTGEHAAQTLARIEQNIHSTEDFFDAFNKYSADNERGVRVCIRGEMIKTFEDAALALKPGERSRVIESAVGAHIILRLELTPDLVDSNIDDLREKDIVRIYRDELDNTAKNLEIVYE